MNVGWAETPLGWTRIKTEDGLIKSIDFVERKPLPLSQEIVPKVLLRANESFRRNLPIMPLLSLSGTTKQQLIWETLSAIPRGNTVTYGEVAYKICPRSHPRVVARFCAQNIIGGLIPCHRVVGKSNIGGYRWGINLKKELQEWEKRAGESEPFIKSYWTKQNKRCLESLLF